MKPSPGPLRQQVLRDPVHWLPFGFGSGLLPVAPGTWGSLLALGIFWVAPVVPDRVFWPALAVAFVLGVWLCGLSSGRLGIKDPSGIVFDEMVGMWLVLQTLPREPLWFAAAFLLFRLLDVWKPWPIREADHRIPGGLGIMLDDALAAVLAAVVLSSLRSVAASLT